MQYIIYMDFYIHKKYGRMYKEAYSSGLIKEVIEFHQGVGKDKKVEKHTGYLDGVIRKLINLLKDDDEDGVIINKMVLIKLSDEQLSDLMRNIAMFFIYIYNDTSHDVDIEYLEKFDLLSKSYNVSLVRPFMNIDMIYAVLKTIVYGKDLESIGMDYILDEYTFHENFFVDPDLDDYSEYYNDYFTMDFMNNSFSINWPKNNPLIVKK